MVIVSMVAIVEIMDVVFHKFLLQEKAVWALIK